MLLLGEGNILERGVKVLDNYACSLNQCRYNFIESIQMKSEKGLPYQYRRAESRGDGSGSSCSRSEWEVDLL